MTEQKREGRGEAHFRALVSPVCNAAIHTTVLIVCIERRISLENPDLPLLPPNYTGFYRMRGRE